MIKTNLVAFMLALATLGLVLVGAYQLVVCLGVAGRLR
jgi:hypothetical protein